MQAIFQNNGGGEDGVDLVPYSLMFAKGHTDWFTGCQPGK
jgi:hypothetical protein